MNRTWKKIPYSSLYTGFYEPELFRKCSKKQSPECSEVFEKMLQRFKESTRDEPDVILYREKKKCKRELTIFLRTMQKKLGFSHTPKKTSHALHFLQHVAKGDDIAKVTALKSKLKNIDRKLKKTIIEMGKESANKGPEFERKMKKESLLSSYPHLSILSNLYLFTKDKSQVGETDFVGINKEGQVEFVAEAKSNSRDISKACYQLFKVFRAIKDGGFLRDGKTILTKENFKLFTEVIRHDLTSFEKSIPLLLKTNRCLVGCEEKSIHTNLGIDSQIYHILKLYMWDTNYTPTKIYEKLLKKVKLNLSPRAALDLFHKYSPSSLLLL
jgi:hypothetical protein